MIRAAFLLSVVTAVSLHAQIVETPVAFDSAGKVRSLTPALVSRFELQPPVWPVLGDFVEARLFTVSTGGSVLVVQRGENRIERYSLVEPDVAALRGVIDDAMQRIGARVGEERPDVFSEPARGAFVRNQMIIAAALYGPLLASLTNDGKTGTALYLLTVGGSYFALSGIPKATIITRAQNDLATDGALRGYAAANAILITLGGDDIGSKTHRFLGLAGAVTGSVVGYHHGRRLTDSEAHAAMKFSTFAAGSALGVLVTAGVVDEGSERAVAATMAGAGVAGYLLGPRYPRRAKYTVTAGDVKLLPIGALLGVMAGITPFMRENVDAQVGFAAATAGGLAGIALVDRTWVRNYDHGSGDVTQVWLGTIAGGILGAAVLVLTETDEPPAIMAILTGGGLLGALAGHQIASPAAAGSRALEATRSPVRVGGARLEFDPASVAFAAARIPGRHALVRVTF